MNPLVEKRFKRSLESYNDNAIIQEKMAETLIGLLPQKEFRSVLEIGCGTGLLTKKIVRTISPQLFHTNDIVEECQTYINKIDTGIEFFSGDINNLNLTEKYDLIISNAVFQWFAEPYVLIDTLKNHLSNQGVIAFSSFGKNNFYELKELLGFGLDYQEFADVTKEEVYELEFNSFAELLKHIKATGVNAIKDYPLTKGKVKLIEQDYIAKYGKIKLTYNPIFVII